MATNHLVRIRPSDNVAWKLGLGFILHVPLALLMLEYQLVGLLHMLVTLGVGLWLIISTNKYERAAFVSAYIVGAEVLWRMTKTPIFWESGKYAAFLVLLVAMLRHRRFKFRLLPIIYFILLLPALLMVFSSVGFENSRAEISFNLSGPLTVMISALYFSQLRLTHEQFYRLLLVICIPVCGIATIALYTTVTSRAILFNNSSNFSTSGGFGPNQVSSILGLAALVAFYYVLNGRSRIGFKALLLGLIFLFATFSALTFSRNGLVTAAAGALASSIFLLKGTRTRLKVILVLALMLAGAYYVIVPTLDNFTSGAIISRFGNTSVTGRDRMVMTDLRVWWDNPLFGVGPGMVHTYYESMFGLTGIPAHTEFSRMLSEHGMLGLVSLLLLIFMAIDNFNQSGDMKQRALIIGLLIWTLLYMLSNAMRLLAPAFIFGVTFARAASVDPQYIRRYYDAALAKNWMAARPHTAGRARELYGAGGRVSSNALQTTRR
jgi:O-antigen ligase